MSIRLRHNPLLPLNSINTPHVHRLGSGHTNGEGAVQATFHLARTTLHVHGTRQSPTIQVQPPPVYFRLAEKV